MPNTEILMSPSETTQDETGVVVDDNARIIDDHGLSPHWSDSRRMSPPIHNNPY
jgi:hypothetical protein